MISHMQSMEERRSQLPTELARVQNERLVISNTDPDYAYD